VQASSMLWKWCLRKCGTVLSRRQENKKRHLITGTFNSISNRQ
jgi:hypothetical protein